MKPKMKLHVIIVAYCKAIPLRGVIDSFVNQTRKDWELHIVHDGPAPQDVWDVIALYKNDQRIQFEYTPDRYGEWGHSNRRMMLKKLPLNHRDFVLITNDDNYYVPKFVEYFMRECHKGVGMVYCDTVHSYEKYNVLVSQLKENYIDMGSFIVKLDIAKKVGFNCNHLSADGAYAAECADYCRRVRLGAKHIEKPLFVHN